MVHHNRFMALFPGHPGEPVPDENFWTLWCKGRLTEADTATIRLGATPSGLTSAHLHHPVVVVERVLKLGAFISYMCILCVLEGNTVVIYDHVGCGPFTVDSAAVNMT